MEFVNRKIHLDLNKEFPFQIVQFHHTDGTVPTLHCHECLEVQLVERGEGVNIIGDRQYTLQSGEVFIINNNEYHHAFTDGEILVFHFDPSLVWADNVFDYEYLMPFYERVTCFHNKLEAGGGICQRIADGMHEIVAEYEEKQEGYRLVVKAQLLRILSLIYRNMKKMSSLDTASAYMHKKDFGRIRIAVEYIEQNYTEDLSLRDLSSMVYLNETNFSTLFKKVMKKTVTEYITSLRINRAARLLKEGNTNITGICYKSGFQSVSQFNKTFKRRMRVTPRQYRNNLTEA